MSALQLRPALRSLARRPLFSISVLAVLAVAIGTATAVSAVARGVLLRPLAFPESERLVAIWARLPGVLDRSPLTNWDLVQLRREIPALSGIAGYYQNGTVVRAGEHAEWMTVARTTPNLFAVLGLEPAAGRFFDREDADGAVVVVSRDLFQDHFGARQDLLREGALELRLWGKSRTVIGVFPSGLDPLPSPGRKTDPVDVFVPIRIDPVDPDRSTGWLRVVGRLRAGISAAQLEGELKNLTRHVAEVVPQRADNGFELFHLGLLEDAVSAARPALLVLLGAGLLMFAIACANVAGLLVARGEERRAEAAIREVLGCGRARLVAQLAGEAALLVAGGSIAGLWLGASLLQVVRRIGLLDLPRADRVQLDGSALLVVAVLALVALAVAGLGAAWRAFSGASLRSVAGSGTRTTRSSGRWLVAGEVALTLVLLIAAGLLLRSLTQLRRLDPGFDARGVLTFDLALSQRHADDEAGWRWLEELEDRIRALPGVDEVGLVNRLPLGGGLRTGGFATETEPDQDLSDDGPMLDYRLISPGYLRALGNRLVEGRGLSYRDDRQILVDQRAAARIWPGESALGRRLKLAPVWKDGSFVETWFEVVGVVAPMRHESLIEDGRGAVFLTARMSLVGSSYVAVVRGSGDPRNLVKPVRSLLAELDPDVPMTRARSMDSFVDAALAPTRTPFVLVAAFALLGVILAGVGLYSLVVLQVEAREREIGIRIALGADRRNVLRDLVASGLRSTGLGIGIGLLAMAVVLQPLRALLVEVSWVDALVCAAVVLLLLAINTFSSWLPARRATRIDPIHCLRPE